MLEKYQDVFEEGIGTFKATKTKIVVEENASPRYCKARSVPYALKDQIEKELQRLEEEGTNEQVIFSEWAAPIVPIVKEDQSIRICGDYKVTVNSMSKLDNYPIPKAEDLFATLGGGEKFTKLDLSQAYQQLPLEEDSKQYTTINTHRACFNITGCPMEYRQRQVSSKELWKTSFRGLHTSLFGSMTIWYQAKMMRSILLTLNKS